LTFELFVRPSKQATLHHHDQLAQLKKIQSPNRKTGVGQPEKYRSIRSGIFGHLLVGDKLKVLGRPLEKEASTWLNASLTESGNNIIANVFKK
jgi:hypothetical protein